MECIIKELIKIIVVIDIKTLSSYMELICYATIFSWTIDDEEEIRIESVIRKLIRKGIKYAGK